MVTALARGMSGPVGYRVPRSTELYSWQCRIEAAARANRRSTAVGAAIGIALYGVVVALCVGMLRFAGKYRPDVPSTRDAVAVGAAICFVMLLTAFVVKPAGRGEVASQIVEQGFRSTGNPGVPGGNVIVMVMMLLALYGSLLVVEAFWDAVARWKVRRLDTSEAARILAEAAASPTGVPVKCLLKHGQAVDALRVPVAALALDGWVVLREGGRVIEQRAPGDCDRGWRSPLAAVFGG